MVRTQMYPVAYNNGYGFTRDLHPSTGMACDARYIRASPQTGSLESYFIVPI
jgi:hypothetical protein